MNSQLTNTNYSSETDLIIQKEDEIKNRNELIKYMINNLFVELNISDINNGNDEKKGDKNISIVITSTKNQKKKRKWKNDNNRFRKMWKYIKKWI